MTEIEKELEKEIEKKFSIGKAKVGLVVCAVLVVILAISNVFVYVNLQNQINALETDNARLHSQLNTLQTEKSSLESEVNNLQTQVDRLTSDKNSLQSQVDSLTEENDYLWEEMEYARFDFYYVFPAEQKFGVYDLEDELYGYEWIDPYQEGVFDCSEMSAYLERELENKGWHTYIIAGDSPFGSGKHAWLLVETSLDHYMPVETTTIEIVWWDDPYFDNYFVYDYEFETIQEAIAYNESEFDWWK